MELIEEIESKRDTKGILRKQGKFLCLICKNYIEKRLDVGLRDASCGCNRNEHKTKHGGYYTNLYKVWIEMKQRILNINSQAYKDYGSRGITICPEWTNDYTKFRDWSLNNGYQEGLEIDREDNDGNYEPSNCRFVTREVNGQNRRTVKLTIELANEIRTLHKTDNYIQEELAVIFSVSRKTIGNIVNNKIWKI